MTRYARERGVSRSRNAHHRTVRCGRTDLKQTQRGGAMGKKTSAVMSYREVARRLGMSATGVRKVEQRALKKIKLKGQLENWRECYAKEHDHCLS